MKFELGQEVKEIVTGFRGIVMGRTEYATGCKHYGVLPRKLKADGDIQEWKWLDESRLQATGKKVNIVASIGGPQSHSEEA